MHRFCVLGFCAAFVLGCGARESAAAPSGLTESVDVAEANAAPVEVAPKPFTTCSVGASTLIEGGRRKPLITLDGQTVAVTHRPARPMSSACDRPDAHVGGLPLGSSEWRTLIGYGEDADAGDEDMGDDSFEDERPSDPNCSPYAPRARAERVDGHVVVSGCAFNCLDADEVYEDNPRARNPEALRHYATCSAQWPGNDGMRMQFETAGGTEASRFDAYTTVAKSENGYLFVAATNANGRRTLTSVFRSVNAGTTAPPIKLGSFRTSSAFANDAKFALSLTVTEGGGFVLDFGDPSEPKVSRIEFNANGVSTGSAQAVEREAKVAAVAFTTEQAPRTAPHIRVKLGDGEAKPVTGIEESIGTFAPRLLAVGPSSLLIWSEGTGNATRIRGALFDPATGSVSAPFLVSAANYEAGTASVDVHEGRIVVAWDEKRGSEWSVLAAEIHCE